jgi:hypothetical protein
MEIAPTVQTGMQMAQPLHLLSSTTAFFAAEEIAFGCNRAV